MSGTLASSFTAFISHTRAGSWWKRSLGEIVYNGLKRGQGDGVYVSRMHVYPNVWARAKGRERTGLL